MRNEPPNPNKKPSRIFKQTPASATDNELYHLAFENSLQANIVSTVSSGKIILANRAACKLLAYSKKELLATSREVIFDISEKSFKKMLRQRTAEGHSKAFITAIKKGGKPVPCEITSAVFLDESGIERSITTIVDMGKSIRKQKNIDTGKEKIVADNIVLALLNQKNIDARKEKIVADNIVLATFNQKNIDARKEKIVADNIVLAISKQKNIDTRKEKIVADNIVLAISKQIKIDAKNKKIVAGNIILAQAKSDREKLNQENTTRAEYKENFKLIFNSSCDIFYDIDLVTGELIISDAYEKQLGYKVTNNIMSTADWISHIHPDDKETVMYDYYAMLTSKDTERKYAYRLLRADDSVANISGSSIIMRNSRGIAYRVIGSMQDMSKQKVLEEKLEREIQLKEKQIEEAMQDAKETERSDIGKELHDNVNQLLSTSKLYLDMAKRGGEDSKMYLTRSSEYTLSAIEVIRNLTRGLTTDTIKNLGLCEAMDDMIRDTMEVNPVKIYCSMAGFEENSVNDKFKLNLFRILQEQLNNIIKHARATRVTIRLTQTKKSITLTISDNGVGFDAGKKRKGIGVANIKSRAAAYNGNTVFVTQPAHGCILVVKFPSNDMLLKKVSTAEVPVMNPEEAIKNTIYTL